MKNIHSKKNCNKCWHAIKEDVAENFEDEKVIYQIKKSFML